MYWMVKGGEDNVVMVGGNVMYFKYIRSELNQCVCVCVCVHVAKYRRHTICITKLNINVLSIYPSIRASA